MDPTTALGFVGPCFFTATRCVDTACLGLLASGCKTSARTTASSTSFGFLRQG